MQNNKYKVNPEPFRLPQVLLAAAKGSECFDCDFYLQNNKDLGPAFKSSPMQCILLFNHWINYGQFEGRPSKYAPCLSCVSRSRCTQNAFVGHQI